MKTMILKIMSETFSNGDVTKTSEFHQYMTNGYTLTLRRQRRITSAELLNKRVGKSVTYFFANMADFKKTTNKA